MNNMSNVKKVRQEIEDKVWENEDYWIDRIDQYKVEQYFKDKYENFNEENYYRALTGITVSGKGIPKRDIVNALRSALLGAKDLHWTEWD